MPFIFSSRKTNRKASNHCSEMYAKNRSIADFDSVYSYEPKEGGTTQQQSAKSPSSPLSSERKMTPEELAGFQRGKFKNDTG